jgi:ABC-type transporter Mla maintaining outer membrane lipid asymmetry permease subunit MlaE
MTFIGELLDLLYTHITLSVNCNRHQKINSLKIAFIISSVPAYYGYYVTGGALEIGRSSTTSVVISCILILVADFALAALLL